jgi:hypothetical protein
MIDSYNLKHTQNEQATRRISNEIGFTYANEMDIG